VRGKGKKEQSNFTQSCFGLLFPQYARCNILVLISEKHTSKEPALLGPSGRKRVGLRKGLSSPFGPFFLVHTD
jgi:hypothetical protein